MAGKIIPSLSPARGTRSLVYVSTASTMPFNLSNLKGEIILIRALSSSSLAGLEFRKIKF